MPNQNNNVSIEIRAKDVVKTQLHDGGYQYRFQHMYILYTNPTGDKFILRAGPTNSNLTGYLAGKIKVVGYDEKNPFPYTAANNATHEDWDQHNTHVTLAKVTGTEDQLLPEFQAMQRQGRWVHENNWTYNILNQNSNSVVTHCLKVSPYFDPSYFDYRLAQKEVLIFPAKDAEFTWHAPGYTKMNEPMYDRTYEWILDLMNRTGRTNEKLIEMGINPQNINPELYEILRNSNSITRYFPESNWLAMNSEDYTFTYQWSVIDPTNSLNIDQNFSTRGNELRALMFMNDPINAILSSEGNFIPQFTTYFDRNRGPIYDPLMKQELSLFEYALSKTETSQRNDMQTLIKQYEMLEALGLKNLELSAESIKKLNALLNAQKHTNDTLDKIYEFLTKPQTLHEKVDTDLQGLYQGFKNIINIAQTIGSKNLVMGATIGMHMTTMMRSINSLSSLNSIFSLASFEPCTAMLGAAVSLFMLFKSKNMVNPHQVILDKLNDISKQIYELQTSLISIHQDLQNRLEIILNTLQQGFKNITAELYINRILLASKLEELHADLNQIGNQIHAQLQNLSLQSLLKIFDKIDNEALRHDSLTHLTEEQSNQILGKLTYWILNQVKSDVINGAYLYNSAMSHAAIGKIVSRTSPHNIPGFLIEYAAKDLNVNLVTFNLPIIQPMIWTQTMNYWLRVFEAKTPYSVNQRDPNKKEIQSIIESGSQVITFYSQIRSVSTIFTTLFSRYEDSVKQLLEYFSQAVLSLDAHTNLINIKETQKDYAKIMNTISFENTFRWVDMKGFNNAGFKTRAYVKFWNTEIKNNLIKLFEDYYSQLAMSYQNVNFDDGINLNYPLKQHCEINGVPLPLRKLLDSNLVKFDKKYLWAEQLRLGKFEISLATTGNDITADNFKFSIDIKFDLQLEKSKPGVKIDLCTVQFKGNEHYSAIRGMRPILKLANETSDYTTPYQERAELVFQATTIASAWLKGDIVECTYVTSYNDTILKSLNALEHKFKSIIRNLERTIAIDILKHEQGPKVAEIYGDSLVKLMKAISEVDTQNKLIQAYGSFMDLPSPAINDMNHLPNRDVIEKIFFDASLSGFADDVTVQETLSHFMDVDAAPQLVQNTFHYFIDDFSKHIIDLNDEDLIQMTEKLSDPLSISKTKSQFLLHFSEVKNLQDTPISTMIKSTLNRLHQIAESKFTTPTSQPVENPGWFWSMMGYGPSNTPVVSPATLVQTPILKPSATQNKTNLSSTKINFSALLKSKKTKNILEIGYADKKYIFEEYALTNADADLTFHVLDLTREDVISLLSQLIHQTPARRSLMIEIMYTFFNDNQRWQMTTEEKTLYNTHQAAFANPNKIHEFDTLILENYFMSEMAFHRYIHHYLKRGGRIGTHTAKLLASLKGFSLKIWAMNGKGQYALIHDYISMGDHKTYYLLTSTDTIFYNALVKTREETLTHYSHDTSLKVAIINSQFYHFKEEVLESNFDLVTYLENWSKHTFNENAFIDYLKTTTNNTTLVALDIIRDVKAELLPDNHALKKDLLTSISSYETEKENYAKCYTDLINTRAELIKHNPELNAEMLELDTAPNSNKLNDYKVIYDRYKLRKNTLFTLHNNFIKFLGNNDIVTQYLKKIKQGEIALRYYTILMFLSYINKPGFIAFRNGQEKLLSKTQLTLGENPICVCFDRYKPHRFSILQSRSPNLTEILPEHLQHLSKIGLFNIPKNHHVLFTLDPNSQAIPLNTAVHCRMGGNNGGNIGIMSQGNSNPFQRLEFSENMVNVSLTGMPVTSNTIVNFLYSTQIFKLPSNVQITYALDNQPYFVKQINESINCSGVGQTHGFGASGSLDVFKRLVFDDSISPSYEELKLIEKPQQTAELLYNHFIKIGFFKGLTNAHLIHSASDSRKIEIADQAVSVTTGGANGKYGDIFYGTTIPFKRLFLTTTAAPVANQITDEGVALQKKLA